LATWHAHDFGEGGNSMTLSKERLRKIHGVADHTNPTDQSVIARRKFHESAAKWLSKWLVPMQALFGFIGFFVVLLPVLLKPWRALVEDTPLLAQVFHDYSTFSGWALINLYIGMLTAIVKIYWAKHSPGGSILSYRDVVHLQDYPRTKKEEVFFLADAVGTILVTTVWLFLPFGVIAYFIRMGN
jgi:hypothetical protein